MARDPWRASNESAQILLAKDSSRSWWIPERLKDVQSLIDVQDRFVVYICLVASLERGRVRTYFCSDAFFFEHRIAMFGIGLFTACAFLGVVAQRCSRRGIIHLRRVFETLFAAMAIWFRGEGFRDYDNDQKMSKNNLVIGFEILLQSK
jgi:hypothetical protein